MAIELPFAKVIEMDPKYEDEDVRYEAMTLDLNNDFERIVFEILQLQRSKAQDYARQGDTLRNMREVVNSLAIPGYTVVEDCNAQVIRKNARIVNLRGREAHNESVRDSYVDRAVYSILAIVALDEQL